MDAVPCAHQSARILIVDDKPVNVALLQAVLGNAGYTDVTGLTDPEEALPLHQQAPFDLFLLDIRMPVIDGHEVLRRLRASEADDDLTPVLVLTAQTDQETRFEALRNGANDFLTKPFDHHEVLLRIHNMLEMRWLAKERKRQNRLLAERVEVQDHHIRAIADNAPDAILVTDSNGCVAEQNEAGERLFNGSLSGQPLSALVADPLPERGTLETTAQRLDGSHFPFELSIAPLQPGSPERIVIGRDISARLQAQEELNWLAGHDSATGLANRYALRSAITRAINAQGEATVFAVLISGHRRHSDLFGASSAEALQRMVGETITALMPSEAACGLWGEALFIALHPGELEPEAREHLGRAIQGEIARSWLVEQRELDLDCRVGSACAPEAGDHPDTLVRRATMAAAAARDYRHFEPALEQHQSEWHHMERELRHALERNQLELYYQPKIDLASGALHGAEALMRWHHPEMGLVSPVRFIPIAEETGLIDRFGSWAIEQAARDSHDWAGLNIAVNVSAHQLLRPGLIEAVHRAGQLGLPVERLELEVTESAVMDDTEAALRALHGLSSQGIRLAIDDFGTGYSSLAYLSQMPLSVLKIDQSFVRQLGESRQAGAIVDMIIGLARTLGLSTVAEGIETAEQQQYLIQAGCTLGQGYLWAKPLTRAAFNDFRSGFTGATADAFGTGSSH